jgi:hypothetical protein
MKIYGSCNKAPWSHCIGAWEDSKSASTRKPRKIFPVRSGILANLLIHSSTFRLSHAGPSRHTKTAPYTGYNMFTGPIGNLSSFLAGTMLYSYILQRSASRKLHEFRRSFNPNFLTLCPAMCRVWGEAPSDKTEDVIMCCVVRAVAHLRRVAMDTCGARIEW